MKELIVATSNKGKIKELRSRLESLGINVQSQKEAGFDLNVVEDAPTFAGNAAKKAIAAAEASGRPALADDSGLQVDHLDGRPGIHSARYGDEGLDDQGRYELLLKELSGVPTQKRTARFRAVLAYVKPGNEPIFFEGTVEGHIAQTPAGTYGFGYDPVFIPNGHENTMAELGAEIKSKISHRAQALDGFVSSLQRSQR